MTKERDYLTLDEVEVYTGIKKGSLYYYLRTLGIETHKFTLDKRAYISLADANRIKEVKETPWLAGEKSSQKTEGASILPQAVQHKVASETAPKRVYNRKQDNILPDGCILASKFAEVHGVKRPTFIDHMNIGLGPGLIHGPDVPEDGTVLVKDWVRFEERNKRVRSDGTIEKERYLTSDQQAAALDFWRRHGVRFSQCDRPDCPCHQ